MGSIGVYSGALRGEAVGAILGGRLNFEQPDARYAQPGAERAIIPERINIFPSNSRDYGAFVIDFTDADLTGITPTGMQRDASQALRQSFLQDWKKPTNINTRNADNTYDRTMQDALNAGMTTAQARMTAEDARLAVTRTALENFLSRMQENGHYQGVVIRDFGRQRKK